MRPQYASGVGCWEKQKNASAIAQVALPRWAVGTLVHNIVTRAGVQSLGSYFTGQFQGAPISQYFSNNLVTTYLKILSRDEISILCIKTIGGKNKMDALKNQQVGLGLQQHYFTTSAPGHFCKTLTQWLHSRRMFLSFYL